MHKETVSTQTEFEPYAEGLAKTFIQRWDIHARQIADGSYICIHKPLLSSHIAAHLRGEITLGAYLLDQSNQVNYIVLDADSDEQMARLISLSSSLADQDIPSYMEDSRRGGHLWLFLPHPIPGKDARRFGHKLIDISNLAGIELFPKQDRAKVGPGSLIRLPFGVHRKTGQRYHFITTQHQMLGGSLVDQINLFCAPRRVPVGFIRTILASASPRLDKPLSVTAESPTIPLSKRIKESISLLEFASRFVELSPSGRGRCPFHDDQHASFAVNIEGNYWSCFAGCGGGSIIDFWMKMNKCDFNSAVHQLANMLLKTV